MRNITKLVILLPLLAFVGCVEQSARDTNAALSAVLVAAQDKNLATCQADPKLDVCVLINRGVAADNALVTATETYCNWDPANPPALLTKCTPVKSAEETLKAAIANATKITNEIRGILR